MTPPPPSPRQKPASEQPGNSFRYLYWRLSETEFQQLCAALLRHKYDPVRCFPVRMADEGIDAITDRSTIYQVKWSSKLLQDPAQWLEDAVRGERAKIERLVREKRITRYILITSVAGTTTATGAGSIQRLQPRLDELSGQLGVPIECWWQSDVDAEVDGAPDAIKWSYQEMLAGSDAMRYLIHGSQVEGQAARMRDTVLHVMATQWREDSKVKFSQVDMDRVDLVDVFVDVHTTLREPPRNATAAFISGQNDRVLESCGAVEHLLETTVPLTFILGVPGQGKSTLSQYLAQLHRSAILPGDMLGDRKPPPESVTDPKLPIRVDLKDYAAWLSGRDPFGEDEPPVAPRRRPKGRRSLDLFLADFCSAFSGGRSVTVEEVQSLLARYPTLLILDGLDELAEQDLREIVVEQINLTADRMGLVGNRRRFQILVTARPNASGLPEPDKHIFQTLAMEPLTPGLQREFMNKWCDVHNIHGRARRSMQRIFLDRSAHDHVAQLADNPMQLTILLFLINRKGDAVPVARTPLYTDYMTALMEREVNREQIHRDQVPLVHEVTAFLGWHMHSGVETVPSAGRMTLRDIETTLLIYLRATEGPEQETSRMFKAVSDRFWALSSKEGNTFEFAVQPVREYFAARFLAEWAGRERRDPLPKQQILTELIDRPYWGNTARFYAGFASPNELAGLRYGLEDAIDQGRHPLQTRSATWALLSDGIFTNNTPVQRDVTKLLVDPASIVLIARHPDSAITFPALPADGGGDQLARMLLEAVEVDPASNLTAARVDVLRTRTALDRDTFLEWWTPRTRAAIGTPAQSAWLTVGARFGIPRLGAHDSATLALGDAAHCQAALAAGASPPSRSRTDRTLLQAVLNGWCSDVVTAGSAEAGLLLRAMRPQWYHQLIEGRREGPGIATRHLWLRDADRASRSAALNQLVELDPRYTDLKKAANVRARGQQGTTEPWQNAARVLCRLHGPSLLAAEIAIAGAANPHVRGEGSIDRDGQPFGPQADYGTLVIETRRRPAADWWQTMHDRYRDPMSRQTWCLALLATAPTDVVCHHLPRLDACLRELSDDDYHAVAAASSRLGASQNDRRLGPAAITAAAGLRAGTRLLLLLSQFTADLSRLDPLPDLNEITLTTLASPAAAVWPIVRAASGRMLQRPTATLLDVLAHAGPEDPVELPHPIPDLGDHAATIWKQPARYPSAWLIAAERSLSDRHQEQPLVAAATAQRWVPKVPHL